MSTEAFEIHGGAVEQLGDKIAEQTEELLFEWGRYDLKARKHSDSEQIVNEMMEGHSVSRATLNHRRRLVEQALILPRPTGIIGRSRLFPGLVAATTTLNGEVSLTEGFAVNRDRDLRPANDTNETTAQLTVDAVTLVGDAEQNRKSIYSVHAMRLKRYQSPVLELKSADNKEVGEDEAYFVLDILVKAQAQLKSQMPKLKSRKK